MYPGEWHRIFGDMTGESARRILPPLLDLFSVRSMVEVGCGNAHWSQVAIGHGLDDYRVVDGPWNDRDKLLVDTDRFVEADLSRPLALPSRFDMAICLEVAEHVRSASAQVLVRSLCEASDVILFGAAIPMQGGYGHINEQWPSYWRDLFEAEGYEPFDLVRPAHWKDEAIHYWYRQNAFIYVRRDNMTQMAAARESALAASLLLFDAVHPEKFEEVASYRSIAGARLLRRLPNWIAERLRSKLSGAS